MPTPLRQHRRVNTTTFWAVVAAAILIHGAVIGSVQAFGLSVAGEAFKSKSDRMLDRALEDSSLATSCAGDVLLTTGARTAMCLAPWNDNVEGCTNDAMMAMWMDLSACQGSGEMIAAAPIELMQPRQLETLKPIDPEPLLEELAQLEKKQEPPPPPPELKQQQPPPPTPPAPPPPQRPQQVVEVAKPSSDQEPENARFLSEHNVVVEKQKVARGSVQEPMVAKSKPEELTPTSEPKEASVKEIAEKPPGKDPKAPDAPGTLAMRTPGAEQPSEAPQDARTRGDAAGAKGPLVADGFIPRRGDGAIEQQKRDPGELARGNTGAGGGAPDVPNLKPTAETLERALGGGSVDHLEEVENGDETSLSAKRWVYASFFNRLKRQVAQNWDPATVWRRNDPNGTVHGFKTRVTEVRVSLAANGSLAKVVVTNPSGVNELDEEAVRAFHSAAPFPNPPEGLVKEGLITFAFSFYFEIGQPRTSWRVVRSM
ncbi:MAG: TonB family protein [Myxococcales bacterium]|nr:TonB family protein [Myxococcales bacterium]